METVEVVIRIPQGVLNTIWAYVQSEIDNKNIISDTAYKAIANGTVLPKGHGRLIDAEKLAKEISRAWTLWEKKGEDCYLFSDVLTPMLVSQQTIIEAYKEGDADG